MTRQRTIGGGGAAWRPVEIDIKLLPFVADRQKVLERVNIAPWILFEAYRKGGNHRTEVTEGTEGSEGWNDQ